MLNHQRMRRTGTASSASFSPSRFFGSTAPSVVWRTVVLCLLTIFWATSAPAADMVRHVDLPAKGTAKFVPAAEEAALPRMFQQTEQTFDFSAVPARELNKVRMFKVTFPSPAETDVPQNATVHAEYFQPVGTGPFPGVVVLHILGGDFVLSETICQHLAQQGIAALFVKMPYYGERRGTNGRRMISKDPVETVAGMRQAVLDIRRAAAWLRSRPEVDAQRLGITGISLGGIMATLSASLEPRFQSVAPYLAGGNFGETIWSMNKREAQEFRDAWLAKGGTKESFADVLTMVDPVTHAHRLRGRRVLMVNADKDEVIPPSGTQKLWGAMDKQPEIIWLDGGHYSVARYLPFELFRLSNFFLGQGKPALVLHCEVQAGAKPGTPPQCTLKISNVGTKPWNVPKSAGKLFWRLQSGDLPAEESPVADLAIGETLTLAPGASVALPGNLTGPILSGPGKSSLSIRWMNDAPKFEIFSNVVELPASQP